MSQPIAMPQLCRENSRLEKDPNIIREIEDMSFEFSSQLSDPFDDDDEVMEALKQANYGREIDRQRTSSQRTIQSSQRSHIHQSGYSDMSVLANQAISYGSEKEVQETHQKDIQGIQEIQQKDIQGVQQKDIQGIQEIQSKDIQGIQIQQKDIQGVQEKQSKDIQGIQGISNMLEPSNMIEKQPIQPSKEPNLKSPEPDTSTLRSEFPQENESSEISGDSCKKRQGSFFTVPTKRKGRSGILDILAKATREKSPTIEIPTKTEIPTIQPTATKETCSKETCSKETYSKETCSKVTYSTCSNSSSFNRVSVRALSTTSSKNARAYPTIQLATQHSHAPSSQKTVLPMMLSEEQEHILQQAVSGTSLFYTGAAGTGKSILLKAIIKALKARHRQGAVAVTASTGLAACNIGGTTLHSFAGVGLGAEPVEKLLTRVRRSRKALERWLGTKVLVIDEVSMVDGVFLDKLNAIAKRIRRSSRPFGGIQLVVCGDFYQLPPVVKEKTYKKSECNETNDPLFAFECEAWRENIQLTLELVEVFRQRGDQRFVDMLNEMRRGVCGENTRREFARLSRPISCPRGMVPAQLFATRAEVERSNNERLRQLPGSAMLYAAVDSGSLAEPHRQTMLSNFLAPHKLFLKVGAQVMCIKNYDETLVNGTMGRVVGFLSKDVYLKMGKEKTEHAEHTEAKPDTEHTAKPDSEHANPDSEHAKPDSEHAKPEPEHTEAKAASVSSDFLFSDLELVSDSDTKTRNRKRKKELAAEMDAGLRREYPVVQFTMPDGVSTRTVMFEPEMWTVEDERDNTVLASRVQFPLILAWALSIHKSQGQTLRHVRVDLRNVFEKGQAYVALSRATSREGLQVLNFRGDRVEAHPKVRAFYETLGRAKTVPTTVSTSNEVRFD